MATLTGNKIKDTYDSLIKLSDNGNLTATLKLLSDGFGNSSGVYLNTAGDFKSTGTIEFANFKATAHAVTINKLVNQADGISNNDNDTSLPTSAAVKDYVDTHVTSQDLDFTDGTTQSAIDLDSQVFSILGTTNEIETSASGQQLQIGLPNNVTISGTFTGTTFSGDLNGTINTNTTAVTQSAGNNSTKVATTAYVDTLDAASDLDFSGDSGTGDVNLNTQVLAVTGTANQIVTTANNQGLSLAFPSTITIPNGSVATTQSAGDNSTKIATTAYVDTLDAASDLDIAGDSGTGAINLNTQTFTLAGTTNQITTAISGQTATFSLPSTIHRNLQGNVTGNADTATKWQTARDLSLTSEATGTLSSVDGSGNVSGAVTLLNSAVTGKVLTGLGTPAAGNIVASDSILEAFGKVQSQLNTSKNGLVFKGTWSAATNTPTLTSGGGETDAGTTTSTVTNKLVDSSQNFLSTVSNGNKVINQADGSTALVTNVDSNTTLTLDADIMLSGEAYTIDASPFLQQGQYYVVNVGGTTNLNGNANWAVGDWVIAGASNTWEKLDHSQVDGTGTPGKLTKWATVNTLQDSIVGESGTALTVTGSLTTTLGASVTGDFAVNTNKFTVASSSGNTAFTGDLAINTDKFTVNATNGDTVVAGTGTFAGLITCNNVGNDKKIAFRRTGANNFSIEHDSAFLYFYNETTSNVIFKMANNNDATFTGSITAPSVLANGFMEIRSDTASLYFENAANNNYYRLKRSSNDFVIDYYNGTTTSDRLIIDSSGNVGIGTDSPDQTGYGYKTLTVMGGTGAGDSGVLELLAPSVNADDQNYGIVSFGAGGTRTAMISANRKAANNAANLRFWTAPGGAGIEERMRIDSSGNVSIGTVTPLYLVGTSDVAQISVNRVGTTGAITNTSRSAAYINLNGADGGSSIEFNTASGNNTQPSEKMRIDSNGVIQLPQSGNNGYINFNSTDLELDVNRNPETGAFADANKSHARISISGANGGSNISFKTADANNTVATEKMRITSGGDVGIGTADGPGDVNAKLHIYKQSGDNTVNELLRLDCGENNHNVAKGGAIVFRDINVYSDTAKIIAQRIGNTGGSTLQFALRGSEAMRIQSGGQVLIGTDTTTVSSSVVSAVFGSGSEATLKLGGHSGTHTMVQFFHTGVAVGSITSTTTATAYNTSSDYRLKEDLQDFNGLDKVSKIPVYDFKWKADESRSYGVMAHELQEVLPQAVSGDKDAKEMQSVDYSKIVPLLVKSIQELKTKVDKLKQECKCK